MVSAVIGDGKGRVWRTLMAIDGGKMGGWRVWLREDGRLPPRCAATAAISAKQMAWVRRWDEG